MDWAMTNIDTEDDPTALWDFKVKNGVLQIVDRENAIEQKSFISTYLQRGTVPQLPEVGNQWVEMLTGSVAPQELNAQIRQSIVDNTGGVSYLPTYSEKDGKVVVEVRKVN